MSRDIQNFGEYSVKKVKSFMGREGLGFNADLYRGSNKVAFAYDDASGGEVRIDWINHNHSERELLDRHVASLPQVQAHGMSLTINSGWFVSELVNDFEKERDINKMRRQCETKTFFRVSNQPHGEYRIIKNSCSESVRQHIRTQYGNDVEIFNDVFAQGRIPSVF